MPPSQPATAPQIAKTNTETKVCAASEADPSADAFETSEAAQAASGVQVERVTVR